MDEGRRSRRRRGIARVGDLLPAGRGGRRVSWQGLVGGALADGTALVGVNGSGQLRVMAANETLRQEVLARREHVLGAWNHRAGVLGARKAVDVVCWVRPGLTTRARLPRPTRPRPVEGRYTREADELVGEVRDPGVRRVLVDARARALRAKDERNTR